MNAPIIRKISLFLDFQPLVPVPTVGSYTIRVDGTGVTLLSDDGVTGVALVKSQQFTLDGVDLAQIQAKGAVGDSLYVIGATRTV